jgi:putative radical SAM enzyme (TIGR03279 family)
MGALIAQVYPDTIASSLGLLPGQKIMSLNGSPLKDLIQFQWEWAGEDVSLEVLTDSGIKCHRIHKEYDQGLGVQFETPVFNGIRGCANDCLFCFVSQMAPNCRPSLYIKDDDYRLSFLQGSFVTLTNLSAADLRRIEQEKLSPLYVSVHATDPEVRSRLLGRKGPDGLMKILRRLDEAGIEFHSQVVLCPGYNDGAVLERTVEDLGRLAGALSLAVVPVGLTKYREGLPVLRQVTPSEAQALLGRLRLWQEKFLAKKGSRFVWLSDEFYVLAGQDPPEAEAYEGYPQWENGVGLIRGLLEETEGCALPEALPQPKHLILAGGISAMKALHPLWDRLSKVKGLSFDLLPLPNYFFGPAVNVSGLLTGSCLMRALGGRGFKPGTAVYLPEIMIRDRKDCFLDGLTVAEVSKALGLRLVFLPSSGKRLLARLLPAAKIRHKADKDPEKRGNK